MVHNCANVHSSRYDYEIKNAAKIAEEMEREKARECMFCHRRYLKLHTENFTWKKCIICCREHRGEMLAVSGRETKGIQPSTLRVG